MHFRISLATIALMGFCAAPSVFGQAPAAGQAAPAGPKIGASSIALVDVGYILNNHPNMNANMEAIKAEMTAAQEDIESRRTALLKDQESIGKTFEPDSPQFKQKQESLISAESKLRVDFMGKEKEFAEKQATVIFKSYQSINRAIKLVAEHLAYDVVLRYSREQNEMDPKKPQSVNFGVQRDVLYHNPGIDVTEMVLLVLNRDEPKATAPAAATTPTTQPQVPQTANRTQPGLRKQ
ncbi:MAG: OmpH family outer membrane protein [Planctomycetota bacterium]|nr:OmpH family outer membrane protein [Planctomycetota bacterium]